jgi:DNA/RNA endonuclease G (NUC1)
MDDVHEKLRCSLCDDDENAFIYHDPALLSAHFKNAHPNVFCCENCNKKFDLLDLWKSHKCSRNSGNSKVITPPDGKSIESSKSCFTNDDDIIDQIIPGWPLQATVSIDATKNDDSKSEELKLFAIDQNSKVMQNGTTAILTWNEELNALDFVVEKIEWEKNDRGSAIKKSMFSRKYIRFFKDKKDKHFNISLKLFGNNFDFGHARAAGNCFSYIDFKASFSNLNFSTFSTFNRSSWRILEKRILDETKQFKQDFVTTGAIFSKSKVKYLNGVGIPKSFYKVAFFERYDGKFVIKCFLMYNTNTPQSIDQSEVSLNLIEKLTRKCFLTSWTLEKISPDSLERQLEKLRQNEVKTK